MFEFHLSYVEPNYHKQGDPPFKFPPEGIRPEIDSNLIEIEGRNGTGKTTLLNVLALALGYAQHTKDLETKPNLKRKLESLEGNKSLEYAFRITSSVPETFDLSVERKNNQPQKTTLNSLAIPISSLSKGLDVLFLTEDDPKKIVTVSIEKLASEFRDLNSHLSEVLSSLTTAFVNIAAFRKYQAEENSLVLEITGLQSKAEELHKKRSEVESRLRTALSRDEVKEKLAVLENADEITKEYDILKYKQKQLLGKNPDEILRKLQKENRDLTWAESSLREIDARILQTAASLASYGVQLDTDKLLNEDYEQFEELASKLKSDRKGNIRRKELVVAMIMALYQFYEDDIVPIIEEPVREVRTKLDQMKIELSADRVLGLTDALENYRLDKVRKKVEAKRIQEQITKLSDKLAELGDISDVSERYQKADRAYILLQTALREKELLIAQWNDLSPVQEDAESLRGIVTDLDVQIKADENIKQRYEDRLRTVRATARAKPKYEGSEDKLKKLIESLTRIQEKLIRWIRILESPRKAREQFSSVKEGNFGLKDYEAFVKTVGEFLGKQFEPVPYANRSHDVKFFDIESEVFTTTEDREIPMSELSQGQSKMTTLTGSFKGLGKDKRMIVLIDEIAELDPQNLSKAKEILKKEFDSGKVLLAILVRPPRDESQTGVKITGWA